MAPILFWLRENQPDQMQNVTERERLFTFEVDILGNGACDLSLNLKLTERVLACEVNGAMEVEALAEPKLRDDYWAGY